MANMNATAEPKRQTINDLLINSRSSLQDLLHKLNAISDRAGTNRAKAPTAEPACDGAPESSVMCEVADDIGILLVRAHEAVNEIQQIV